MTVFRNSAVHSADFSTGSFQKALLNSMLLSTVLVYKKVMVILLVFIGSFAIYHCQSENKPTLSVYATVYKSRCRFWHVHHFQLVVCLLQHLYQNRISEQCPRYRVAHSMLANSHVLWNTIMHSHINLLSVVYYSVFCRGASVTYLEKKLLISFYDTTLAFFFSI